MPDHCFCEGIRDQLVRQPANTASGVAFIVVAILVLLSTSRGSRPAHTTSSLMRSNTVYPVLYAAAAAVTGAGTIFYHASLTFWGQTADVFGMYLIATFLVLYNLARVVRIRVATAAAMYVIGNTVLFAGLLTVPQARRYAFGVLIVAAVVLEVVARRRGLITTSPKLFMYALAMFAAGFAIWTADITRKVCSPHSLIQGHAVWHLAGAAALWLIFEYLRADEPPALA
jgi:hypothetical protein